MKSLGRQILLCDHESLRTEHPRSACYLLYICGPKKKFCPLRSTKSLVSEWWAMPPRSPHERSPKISTNEMISLAVALLLPPANFVGFEALQRSEWVGDTSHVKEWLTGIHGIRLDLQYISVHASGGFNSANWQNPSLLLIPKNSKNHTPNRSRSQENLPDEFYYVLLLSQAPRTLKEKADPGFLGSAVGTKIQLQKETFKKTMFTIVHHIVNPHCTLEVPIDHQRNKDASYWAYRARKNNGAFSRG